MVKVLFLFAIAFAAVHASAVCQLKMKVYLSDEDNTGRMLPLQYSCSSEKSQACLYGDEDLRGLEAKVKGFELSTQDLYRHSLVSSDATEYFSATSGNTIESISDYRRVEFFLDKSTLMATVNYSIQSMNPFVGQQSKTGYDRQTCVKQ